MLSRGVGLGASVVEFSPVLPSDFRKADSTSPFFHSNSFKERKHKLKRTKWSLDFRSCKPPIKPISCCFVWSQRIGESWFWFEIHFADLRDISYQNHHKQWETNRFRIEPNIFPQSEFPVVTFGLPVFVVHDFDTETWPSHKTERQWSEIGIV